MDVRVARVARFFWGALLRAGLTESALLKPIRAKMKDVTLNLGGIKLTVPKRFFDHYVQQEYEPVTQASFHDLIKPGMTVVDVGAHVGYFALLSAKLVGPQGRVFAIEPTDENLHYLRKNLDSNRADNVRALPFAAGSEHAVRQFHLTGSSDSHGFFPHPLTETVRVVEVEERPVDELVTGPVDAVKIDVEGAELMVLDGMTRIFEENPNVAIWAEWAPSCMRSAGLDPADLPAGLQARGFTDIVVLDDHQRRQRPLDEVLREVNAGTVPRNWYVNLLARRA